MRLTNYYIIIIIIIIKVTLKVTDTGKINILILQVVLELSSFRTDVGLHLKSSTSVVSSHFAQNGYQKWPLLS